MLIWCTLVTVLLLILPTLSQVITTTCEISSVEAGDNATLIIRFGEDLTQKPKRDFSVTHLDRNNKETEILNCVFSNGDVECDQTPCCTWESKVTDVFRVYIHNASQQLEGKFWGLVIPADTEYQQYCNFNLKASTCPTDPINATNSHVTCNNHSVTIGQSCTVTCNSGHYFQENQTSVTYTCVGRNKWSPDILVIFCEEQPNVHTAYLYLLFLLLIVILIVIVLVILLKKRRQRRTKKKYTTEEPLLTAKRSDEQESQQKQKADDYWLECIRTWYPDLQEKTYFLPPFHFKSATYTKEIVAVYEEQVPLPPQGSDVRDDQALERVLQCLHTLADDPENKEVMMVISQLQFGKYCDRPSYAAAVDVLPHPNPLPEEFLPHRYDKGDCDVLIIHSKLGLLTLEIRSVGGNFSEQEMTEQKQDNVVMKEVKKAVKQLNRAEVVLKHLTSDIMNITITKILVLPNISSIQLQRAIKRTYVGQFLCHCLGAQNVDDDVKLCLLSDQLSDKHMSSDGNHNSKQALREQWQHIVMASGPEQLMTSSLYEQLVARFCGPATTVEVHSVTTSRLKIRTLGEAVSETGKKEARLVLFPQQVDILNRSPPRAFLSGPPETGKTIVLIMQGLTWLQRGHNVHVASTWKRSRAATTMIEHQLTETANTSTARSRVHRHQFNFEKDGEVKTAVRRLKSLSEGRQLCVIADEVVQDDNRKSFTKFCDQLIVQVPGVFIWGASLHHDIRPLCLEEVELITPQKPPPVVVRKVNNTPILETWRGRSITTASESCVPTVGPPVMRIKHSEGQSGHTGLWPLDCVECGHEVARVLTELDVGRTGDSNGPPPLPFRGALMCFDYPTDDRVESNGQVTTTASGLVRGLRDRHVPMRVVEFDDEAAIRDTALGVGDLVTVAYWDDFKCLQTNVVVVETGIVGLDFDRLLATSRYRPQLVVIDC